MSTVLAREMSQPQSETVIESDAPAYVSLPQERATARFRRIAGFWLTVFILFCAGAFMVAWFEGLPV